MSKTLPLAAALLASSAFAEEVPSQPPAPPLEYAFTAHVTLDVPLDMGALGGGRRRYIPITGGTVSGPMLTGTILPGGGDWQTIGTDGVTHVEAHYALKSQDGTIIEISNPGVRVASQEITDRLARGEEVDPSTYYFRTAPRFTVRGGPHAWLARHTFVARGIRLPREVQIDVYVVR